MMTLGKSPWRQEIAGRQLQTLTVSPRWLHLGPAENQHILDFANLLGVAMVKDTVRDLEWNNENKLNFLGYILSNQSIHFTFVCVRDTTSYELTKFYIIHIVAVWLRFGVSN